MFTWSTYDDSYAMAMLPLFLGNAIAECYLASRKLKADGLPVRFSLIHLPKNRVQAQISAFILLAILLILMIAVFIHQLLFKGSGIAIGSISVGIIGGVFLAALSIFIRSKFRLG